MLLSTGVGMARVLITGIAGFIGFHLARRLLEEGWAVHGYDNFNDYYDPRHKLARTRVLTKYPGCKIVRGSLENRDAFEAAWRQADPEIVVHLAAQAGVRYSITNPGVYIDSNITGFQTVLEAVRTHRPRQFVYASSSSVYGYGKPPFHEQLDVTNPASLYAATKVANEIFARSYANLFGIPSIGLRFFTVYGPYGRPDMAMYKFARAIRRGEPIAVFGQGQMARDFTYCDDIVQGLCCAMAAETQGARIYNLGKGQPNGLLEMIELIEDRLQTKAQKIFEPMQLGDVRDTLADISLAQKELGYTPTTTLDVGITHFIRWFESTHKNGEFVDDPT